jgi:hypothetical protein
MNINILKHPKNPITKLQEIPDLFTRHAQRLQFLTRSLAKDRGEIFSFHDFLLPLHKLTETE